MRRLPNEQNERKYSEKKKTTTHHKQRKNNKQSKRAGLFTKLKQKKTKK